jgi:hypothetical protein
VKQGKENQRVVSREERRGEKSLSCSLVILAATRLKKEEGEQQGLAVLGRGSSMLCGGAGIAGGIFLSL